VILHHIAITDDCLTLIDLTDLRLQVVLVIGALLQDGRPEPEELQELWDIYSACWLDHSSDGVISALAAIPQAFQKWLSVRVKDSRHERVLLLATSSIQKLRADFKRNQRTMSTQHTQRALEAFDLISVFADQKMQSIKPPKNPSKHSNQST
jgi:hypothetical protein